MPLPPFKPFEDITIEDDSFEDADDETTAGELSDLLADVEDVWLLTLTIPEGATTVSAVATNPAKDKVEGEIEAALAQVGIILVGVYSRKPTNADAQYLLTAQADSEDPDGLIAVIPAAEVIDG